jgi:hypothetical protein
MAFIAAPERKGEWRYGKVQVSISLVFLDSGWMERNSSGRGRIRKSRKGRACHDPQQAGQKTPSPLNEVCKTVAISSLLCSIVSEPHYVSWLISCLGQG